MIGIFELFSAGLAAGGAVLPSVTADGLTWTVCLLLCGGGGSSAVVTVFGNSVCMGTQRELPYVSGVMGRVITTLL